MDPQLSADEVIAHALSTLGSSVRLQLLREIRQPKALGEIAVRTTRGDAARIVSRQAVREHLERLAEIGIVFSRETTREYGRTQEFLVNHQAIYALGEEVRALARTRSLVEPVVETARIDDVAAPRLRGPGLIVVKGLEEGAFFTLESHSAERREWTIGRRRGLDVALDFDPFISAHNSRIVWEGDAHTLVDLAESTNGTMLNFTPLARGGSARLRHGDVIGVGRTVLVYWGAPQH